jgi:chemotaxis signal transduction protein
LGTEAVSDFESAMLALRARRLMRPPEPEEDPDSLWLAQFSLGGSLYAFSLDQLEASLPLKNVSPLPLAPPACMGITRFRGQILPVYSLAGLLGCQGWEKDPSVLLILRLNGKRLCGFDCETSPRPLRFNRDQAGAGQGMKVRPLAGPDGKEIGWIQPEYLLEPGHA